MNYRWENVDLAGRFLRFILGVGILAGIFFIPIVPLTIAIGSLVSFYFLLTAMVAWDPMYSLFYSAWDLLTSKSMETRPVASNNAQMAI